MELLGRLEHRRLRHGAELTPHQVEPRAAEGAAVTLGDHPRVDGRMQRAHALPQLPVVLAVHRGADRFPAAAPLLDLAVVLALVRLRGGHPAELAPHAERDECPRVPDHQDRLEEQLLDPLRRDLRRAEWPHPLPQLGLVALRDGGREAHEIARLRVEIVLFRHPSYLG